MRWRAVVVGLVLLAGMGLAACSDDDDGGGGGGDGRLSAAELASEGDAVCRQFAADYQELAADYQDSPTFTEAQMQELYTKLVPLVDNALNSFQELEPPANLQAPYDAALAQFEQDRGTLVKASESQEEARRFYDAQIDPFVATNEKLTAVGITACGSGASSDEASGETTTTSAAETTTTTG
ncbi:MAG: hypothetical protein ACRD0N_15735 [Acidimicrobiales bacterium]